MQQPKNRLNEDESTVRSKIDRVRSRQPRLTDEFVTLQHGAGGKASAALVDAVFMSGYGNEVLSAMGDSGVVSWDDMVAAAGLEAHSTGAKIAMSTDSYVVNPIVFPGGSIGHLAVHGTVNDLSVAGARPHAISAAFVIEEGLPISTLRQIVADMREAAEAAGVSIITGDTKVVPKGSADKLFITTAGLGIIPPERNLGPETVTTGDKIIVSGPIGDHGMAVMMARGDLAIDAPIVSDTRPVNHMVAAMLDAAPNTKWMRDATRGGLGTVTNELAHATNLAVRLSDDAIAVNEMTRGACDILGIDPLYVANEGTFVAVVPAEEAEAAVEAIRGCEGGENARVIGDLVAEPAATVVLVTGFGGTRIVDMLVGDPLPRIC